MRRAALALRVASASTADIGRKSRNAISPGVLSAHNSPRVRASTTTGDARLDSSPAASSLAPNAARLAAAGSVSPALVAPFAARTYASASQPGSAVSAPAGSPLASAASAAPGSGPGSDQAGKAESGGSGKRGGWNLLFGGGGGAEFANQLKRARQFGQLTTFGKGLPKGGQNAVTGSLKKQEVIAFALAAYAAEVKATHEQLSIPFSVRERIAREAGSSVADVDSLLAKYEWFKEAGRRMQELQDQGKPLPRSFTEIEKMMGGSWSSYKAGAAASAVGAAGPAAAAAAGAASQGPARNSPCPCGSGKRYKRCCGAGMKAT
ncbi:hypothetical protein CLOP_g11858 [Closterium sp. NIES-67]|nr:hypothetical protein CLOP_g11858 [Closterium sp. NIES-67]